MDSDLLKLEDYAPTLKYRNDKYHFIVFELSLIASGKTAGEAYDELRKKYDGLIRDMKAAGQEILRPQPEQDTMVWQTPNSSPRWGNEIKTFLIKMIIVFSLIGVTGIAGTTLLKKNISEVKASLRNFDKISLSPIYSLGKLADKVEKISPERLEEIRQNLHTIATRATPLAAELQPLTAAICPQPSPSEKPN